MWFAIKTALYESEYGIFYWKSKMDVTKLDTAREITEKNEITADYCLGVSNCVLSKSDLIQNDTY